MFLENRNAVIYGGGGAIGGAVARAFAREGAKVFLAGRTRSKLDAVARDISAAGGAAEAAEVDALDEQAVNRHADAVSAKAGGIDIALNAVGILHVQGPPFAELTFQDYAHPITAYTRTHFLTAKAVARHMVKQGSGVILTLSTPGSRMPGQGFLGYGVTCGAIETFSRILAGELAPSGIRVICLRPDAIPEALATSHSREVFSGFAERFGTTVESMLAERARTGTLLKRLPTLAEVANFAAFAASDRAGAMIGTFARDVEDPAMRLISVNVSLPKEVPYQGKTVSTGIFKEPVGRRVMLRTLNLEGDGQADRNVHGGINKAAYAYPFEHYEYWSRELGRTDFTFGQFGENFTVSGMLEDAVRIGDVFRIGSALVEVTQPRAPCFKLGIRMGMESFPKTFMSSGLTGFYMKVLEEGEVGAGDRFERVAGDEDGLSVRDVWRLAVQDRQNLEGARKALRLSSLAPEWRGRLEKRFKDAGIPIE
jgi:MOSC domain-containing protein YiiM/NAD(P)-dependent dehydrogenase (short-subunit alcohol dehydrogenase family)